MPRVKTLRNIKSEELKESKREFILNHFSCRECVFFVPNPKTVTKEGQEARCYCGEYEEKHYEKDISLSGVEWSEKTHLRYIEPTDAFGQIDFLTEKTTNQRPTEYVRISDKDKLEDVMELMEKHWHMLEPSKPSLCISVIGGAKNFVLEGRRKDVFNTGLIQAAQTANAWIVTSGLNLGIVRVVGDAIQEGQTWHFDRRRLSNQLRCLGISPWGYVLNREELICNSYATPVTYRVSNVIETGQPVSLNENHTHYIFVDEGKRLRYGGSESARFRARLGKQMALSKGGWDIPVVLVVVEGGHDVFIDARDCIRERIPVVICCGTGRASDLMNLAFTFRMKHKNEEFKQFRPDETSILLERLVAISGESKKNDALDMIIEILQDPKLITTFDMNKSDDLDLAILFALIKTNSQISRQLELAFTWNRSDIAEEKIFRQGVRIDPESLELTMLNALLYDKPEFVRILLQNGIVLRQFLTVEILRKLYNNSSHRNSFERCLVQKQLLNPVKKKSKTQKIAPSPQTNNSLTTCSNAKQINTSNKTPVYLSTVARLTRRMIGRFSNIIYENDTEELRQSTEWQTFNKLTFVSPFQELFLWAVLHQRQQMALFFWERAEDGLALALIACALYSDMVKSLPDYDTETQAEYASHMDEFEMLAVRLLEECYTMDPESTLYLVENEAPLWGGYNCLFLADKATRRQFVSSVACQNSLFYAWSHGTQASPFAFILTLLCPLLLLSDRFVEFDENRGTDTDQTRLYRSRSSLPSKGSSMHQVETTTEQPSPISDGEVEIQSVRVHKHSRIPFKRRLEILYTAPRTKFFLNTIAYIAFLLFFSYTLLFKIHPNRITVEEAVTMAYFLTLLIDIIRQICVTPGVGGYKLRLWVKINSLVYLDIIAILLALTSMFVRIGLASSFTVAKTFYALTLIICYTRVFRLYGFHPALGPKLVMIQRMIGELVLFLFILAVILVSYGVAVQALLYPNRTTFDWNAIRDVLYYPYWNLYGELNLEYSFATQTGCTEDPDGVTCPQYNFVVPLLLAIYLLLAGILLINLLIAIFSNVFEQVEDNSIQLWKFNMYGLVVEYNKKPVAPVPLSVLQALVEFCQYLVRRCNRSPGVNHGVKQIATKTTDIHSTISMGPRHLGDDLIAELDDEEKDNQNDEGTQLFQFTNRRGSRRMSYMRDLPPSENPVSKKSMLMHRIDKAAVLDEDDDDMRIARQFETNCKRILLMKRKYNRERTIDAGILSIKTSIDKLQAETINLAQLLENLIRETQKSAATGSSQTKTKNSNRMDQSKLADKTSKELATESESQPSIMTRFKLPSGINRSDSDWWPSGHPLQTEALAGQLDAFDAAVDEFNNEMDSRSSTFDGETASRRK